MRNGLNYTNPTGSTVDLTGWTIEDNNGAYAIPGSTQIASGDYLIIARNATGFFNLYGFDPDLGDFTRSLGNSGDQLTLKDDTSSDVDFVAWEDFVLGWNVAASTGKSIQRVPPGVDTDTVNDWVGEAIPDPVNS